MIAERSGGFGVRVHIGDGRYRWLGTYPTRSEAEEVERTERPKHRTCALCGSPGADTHHIDRDRSNNTDENLILLCRSHHRRAHTGRLIWDALLAIREADTLEDARAIAEAALRGTVPEQRPEEETA